MMPIGRRPSLVPSPDMFMTSITDEQRKLAWKRVEAAVDRAAQICVVHQIPPVAIGTVVQLYVESLRAVAVEHEHERGRARVTLIQQIERLREEREPKKQKFGDCGDNHDLLNMDDEQLAGELRRLQSLPAIVP